MTRNVQQVWYITMAFPVPSEAFASVEILELKNQGVDVKIKTLRFRRGDHDPISEQQSIGEEVDVSHSSGTSVIRGVLGALRSPWVATRLIAKLFGSLWQRPAVLVACLWWSLRCFVLLENIRRQRPDVVHLYWGHAPAILGWLILETLPEQKLTTSLSAYDLELNLPISFEVARRCNGVRTWSPSNREAMIAGGIPEDQICVVYQGINQGLFMNAAAPKVPGRMAVAARLIPEKGVAQSIEIAARVRQHYPEAHLFIYGDGPQREALEDQAAQGAKQFSSPRQPPETPPLVTFAGHVDQRALALGMQHAEFFVLPSTHHAERLPNVIKEAIAAGCFVITTPTPDIEKLIADETIGAILPASEIESWVQAIVNQLIRHSMIKAPHLGVRHNVLKSFDVKTTAGEMIAWWGLRMGETVKNNPGSPSAVSGSSAGANAATKSPRYACGLSSKRPLERSFA